MLFEFSKKCVHNSHILNAMSISTSLIYCFFI